MNVSSASVMVCTYNRAPFLRKALDALCAMSLPPHAKVELVVVDNNSTDDTRAVIASAAAKSPIPVVAVHEKRQGKSFALNRGLEFASGDILALTDDDVIPAPDWLSRIVADFRARDVTFVFGKVLPWWDRTPPPELLIPRAQAIWGPLAIVDYGDEPTDYRPELPGQRLPIGANLAFRREVIQAIGAWRTDLGKVNNTLISGEDHEIFMRLRRAGLYAGFYDPEVWVRHFVPSSRLTRRYFRKWFFWHGRTWALMLDDMYPELDMSRVPRIGGVPRFMYRQGLRQVAHWMRTIGRGNALAALIEELHTMQFLGLLTECWLRRIRGIDAPRAPGHRTARTAPGVAR
jgi:glycosyltransferase involved in cell wall biosynthesis